VTSFTKIDKMLSDGFRTIPRPRAITRAAIRYKLAAFGDTPPARAVPMLEISQEDAVELAQEFEHD
jgi:hypothetical protein